MVKLAQRFHDSKSESTEARHVRFRKKFGSSQAIGGRQNPNTMTTVISAEARNFRKHAWKSLCPHVIPSELLTYWRLCPHGSIENVCAMTTPDWDTYRGLLTEVGQPFYPPNIENYAGMVTFIALHGNFGIGDRTGADAVPEASTRTQVTSSARIALQDKIKRRHECMRIMDSLKSFTDFSHIASTIEEVQTLIHARENRDDDVNVDVLTYLVKSVLNGMFSGTLHRVIACGIAFYELLSNSVTNQIALEHVNDLMQQTLKEGVSATFEGLKSTSVLFCWCFVVSVLLAFHRSDDAGKQEREKKKASMKECKLPLSVKTLCIHILCLAHKKSAHSRVWAVELICKTLTTTPSVEMITEVLPIIQRTYIPAVDDGSCMTAEAIRLGVFLKDILTRFTPFEGFPTKKSHNCQSEISSLGSFQQIVQKKFADTLCNRFTTTVLKALSTSTPPVWAAHPSIHPLFRTLTDEWRRELQKRDSSDAAVLIRILITSFVNKLPKETVPQRATAAQLYHDFVQLVAHTVRGRVCNQLLFEIQETFDTGPLPCIQPASLFEMEQILVKTQLFAVCDGLIESFDDAVAPNYNIATSDNGGMEIDSESDESDEETNTNTGILSTISNNHFVQTVRLFVIRQLEILCKVRVAKDCKNELDEVVTRVTHFYIMNGFFRVPEGCEHKGSQLTHVDAVQRQMCRTNAHNLVHNIRWSDQDKKSQSYRSDQKRHGSLQYGWGPLLQKCHSLMETGDAEPVFSNAIGFVQSDSNDSEGSFSYVNNFLGFLCIDEGPNTELDWDVHCCLTHFVLYMWCEDGYITDDFKYQTALKLMEAVAEVKLSKSKDKNSNIKPEKEAQNESLAKERITKDFEKGQDLCVRSLLPLMIQLCCASSNTMHGRIPLRFMERAIERMLMSFPEQLLPIVVHGLTAGSFNKKVSKKNQINIENAQNSFEEYSLPVHTKCVRHPMPGEAVQLRLLSILASRFSTSWHFYMALAPSLEIVHDMWNRRFSTLLPAMEDKEVESSCKGLLTALVAWSGHRSVPVSNEKIAQKYCSVILELVDCATRLLTVIRCHRKEGRLSEPKWFKESILRIVSNCVAHAEEHEERVRAVLTAVGNIFINLLVPKKNALNEPENKKAAKLGSACTITPELLQMVLSIVPETFWVQHVLATAQFMKVYSDASQASTRYTLSVRCAHIGVMLRFYTQRRRLAVRSKHEAKDCFGDMSFGKWFTDFLHKWSPWKQLSQLSVTTSAPVDQGDSLLGETSTAEMNRKIAFLMDALLPTLVPLLTCPVWKDCASVAETMSDCLTYLRQRMSFMTSRTKSYLAQLAVHSAAPLTTTELENIAIVPRSQLFSVAHQRECAQKRSRNPRPGGRQDSPMEQNPVDTISETEPTPGNPIPDHSEERKQKRKRRKNGDVTTASRTRLNKSDHMKSSEEQKREKLIRRQTILERKREKRKRRKQA